MVNGRLGFLFCIACHCRRHHPHLHNYPTVETQIAWRMFQPHFHCPHLLALQELVLRSHHVPYPLPKPRALELFLQGPWEQCVDRIPQLLFFDVQADAYSVQKLLRKTDWPVCFARTRNMVLTTVLLLPRRVRPRTSAWYYLYVEATRRNLILPDLPVVITKPRN